jgi:AcrR family transcriptional regulator
LRLGKTKLRKRPSAGRPAACEAAERLEHLLDTATEVFLEQGYKNAKVSEIANRAGASKSTLYTRYPTKADLFVAVITRKTRALQESFAETLIPGKPLKKALEAFGGSLLRTMSRPEKRALYKVFIAESSHFPALARKFWDVGPKRSMEMLRDYLRIHPEFKGKHPEYAAETFWSLCCGQSILKAQLHKNYVIPKKIIESNVREAVRIFLAAYT